MIQLIVKHLLAGGMDTFIMLALTIGLPVCSSLIFSPYEHFVSFFINICVFILLFCSNLLL